MKKKFMLQTVACILLVSCTGRQTGQTESGSPNEKHTAKSDDTITVEGSVTIGHEVRSFTAYGDTLEYWLTDKSGRLMEEYNKAVPEGVKNYTPADAVLKVIDRGCSSDGFAADYDGVYEVIDIISIKNKSGK